jgi:hypothetical protein
VPSVSGSASEPSNNKDFRIQGILLPWNVNLCTQITHFQKYLFHNPGGESLFKSINVLVVGQLIHRNK